MQAKSFFTDVLHISDMELVQALLSVTEYRHLNKGEMLIREGERQREFVFLVKGILRGFFLDVNGYDITDCLAFRCGTPAMSPDSNNAPSQISIEALSDCDLLCVAEDVVEKLMKEYPQLIGIYNAMLRDALKQHWEVKNMVCQHSAMERYLWFCKAYPGLIGQVRNKYIASFLGMTPVTLSRLRRTLREQEQIAEGYTS